MTAVRVPGRQMIVADILSRSTVKQDNESDTDQKAKAFTKAVVTNKQISQDKLSITKQATLNDPDLWMVIV